MPRDEARRRAWRRAWNKRNPDKVRQYQLNARRAAKEYQLRQYGITLSDKERMAAAQKGKCAICKKRPLHLCVDHCHKSKKVRGLLCRLCNLGIGNLKDNPVILRAAATYLETNG